MKPRVDGERLTVEDFCIWLSLAARYPHLRYPYRRILSDDRRDAEWMFEAALWRWALDAYVRRPDGNAEAIQYHVALYHRFLATGERPPFVPSVVVEGLSE